MAEKLLVVGSKVRVIHIIVNNELGISNLIVWCKHTEGRYKDTTLQDTMHVIDENTSLTIHNNHNHYSQHHDHIL